MIGTRVEARQPVPAISWESIVLFLICLGDAMSTAILASSHKIVEANPLMARCLQHGTFTFLAVKMSTVVVLLLMAEYHRRSNPEFVKGALRIGIAAYTALYVSLVFAVNCL